MSIQTAPIAAMTGAQPWAAHPCQVFEPSTNRLSHCATCGWHAFSHEGKAANHADPRDRAADIKTTSNLLLDEERKAYTEYTRLLAREKDLERRRTGKKVNAALRLMETVNPLSGEKQTKYSGTAAFDAVTLDREYRAYVTELDEITLLRTAAYEKLQSVRNEIAPFLAELRVEGGFLP